MALLRNRGLWYVIGLFVVCVGPAPRAQGAIPPPASDPGSRPNVFYGAANPLSGPKAAVLVFVHGLSGTASDWWLESDMYEMSYRAGYRTAFISLSADNSRNNGTIAQNAAMLQAVLPAVAQRFQANKLYLIGHSKGAVDIQAALINPAIARLAEAVFTISAPNSGTELADWAFEHPVLAKALGLLTPSVDSLRTYRMGQFRMIVDPILRQSGIPFYTMAGTVFYDNPVTTITGAILRSLTPNINNDSLNDGMVTVARSRLPGTYSADLGLVSANHFRTISGSITFHKIRSVIAGLELTFKEFERIAVDGFSEYGGDSHNSWAWSMKWFKGQLYVGTARENLCTAIITSDVRTGTSYYPHSVQGTQCPDYTTLLQSLGAEVWRYTVGTKQWQRVFKSPDEIPTVDFEGNPILAAREVGFRGMEVFVEPDGTEALYVGSVTSGSFLEPAPFQPGGFPPPRILRTTDGTTWEPLPQAPGTFLGEVGNLLVNPTTKYRSFRSLASYNGRLFATLADFVGVGPVIAADNPAAGGDAWYFAGPSERDDFPVWNLKEFNGFLYATTGLTRDLDPDGTGYGVYKTDATGTPPYSWTPVVTDGGYQTDRTFLAPNGLSMEVFKGQLYVGTNRPTELIRINPDDTWDLVVGEPRLTPDGFKMPISGLGNGFGSWFNGHFWRMAAWGDHLYLATWDWSVGVQQFLFLPDLDKLFSSNYGLNIYRTSDGVHWTALTMNGLGDPQNSGGRSIEATPYGLFIGGTRERGGLQIFRTDGPPPEPLHLPAPKNLTAAAESEVGRVVALSWDPSPGAVRYHVYRALVVPLRQLFGSQSLSVVGPDGTTITATYQEIQQGKLDALCAGNIGDTTPCAAVDAIRQQSSSLAATDAIDATAFPLPFQVVAVPTNMTFEELAPTALQSLYFVRAEDGEGNLSPPSNLVGGPSKATFADAAPVARCQSVIVPCVTGTCAANASVDAGSFDMNNRPLTLTQEPPGPYPLGTTDVLLTVSNGGRSASCSATVTVVDQQPPTISPPSKITSRNDTGVCAAVVHLAQPTVGDNCAISSITNDAPAGNVFPVGTTVVNWTVTDSGGNTVSAPQTVTVMDTEGPKITSLSIDRSELWPPNHTLVPVVLNYTLSDNCTPPTALRGEVRVVVSDADFREAVRNTLWTIADRYRVWLRSEREGRGPDRTYTLQVRTRDQSGNVAEQSVSVQAPKSRGRR